MLTAAGTSIATKRSAENRWYGQCIEQMSGGVVNRRLTSETGRTMYTRRMDTPPHDVQPIDPVVEAYKKDVDRSLLDRNLQLTPTERIEQLQRFVAFMIELQQAGERARASAHGRQAD